MACIVSGCHPGDCHYTAGNYRARRRWILFRDLLDTLGVDLARFDLAWISAAEGAKWVKTIQTFTDKISKLGPYESMHRLAAGSCPGHRFTKLVRQRSCFKLPRGNGDAAPADSKLVAAVSEALGSGKVKAVIGWTRSCDAVPAHGRRGSPHRKPSRELVAPGGSGNLARLLKNPQLKKILPAGHRRTPRRGVGVERTGAGSADRSRDDSVFLPWPTMGSSWGRWTWQRRSTTMIRDLPADRPVGFSDAIFQALDELMAKPPDERWAFWTEQSAKCIKCYACRGSCPMCSCAQCFTDKNQPQWFPTAADGPGNFAWHLLRAFHLAGRCVGCGACQDACPARIPLNVLSAAMARSALKHFGHRAGIDPKGVPLQSDFKTDDQEDFIL